VLFDRSLFTLDPERYDAFVHALDSPPAAGPKLRALLRRVPAWEACPPARQLSAPVLLSAEHDLSDFDCGWPAPRQRRQMQAEAEQQTIPTH
jgi:hypothetical protein